MLSSEITILYMLVGGLYLGLALIAYMGYKNSEFILDNIEMIELILLLLEEKNILNEDKLREKLGNELGEEE